ncbi:carbohydrate-binding family 9-like protein [Pedobacter xixiisoli]|uniref:Carbohydrate-binding family 9 n=1 Tax=Pedobacter xixiisoli TaxID=1476464 RepID=A0A285ZPK9_9SPHI|nr:carbohydrate-binding family 9-like protein [Pedobacter xixiisoli]SOD11582.1 Carbohydrate-binding family 9 [Pedobacter xixiisoli]
MKKINVNFLSNINKHSSFENINKSLSQCEKTPIQIISWEDFQHKPEAYFSIGYNDALFLKFYVTEDDIRAVYKNTNDPVYEDSCVELFIAFKNSDKYYNFEFNCFGTCLIGYGDSKENRQLVSPQIIRNIKTETLIKPEYRMIGKLITWQLTIVVPLNVFCFDFFESLKNQTAKANFYKCGDKTDKRHYLSWNPIDTPKPDFHQPESFGTLIFE